MSFLVLLFVFSPSGLLALYFYLDWRADTEFDNGNFVQAYLIYSYIGRIRKADECLEEMKVGFAIDPIEDSGRRIRIMIKAKRLSTLLGLLINGQGRKEKILLLSLVCRLVEKGDILRIAYVAKNNNEKNIEFAILKRIMRIGSIPKKYEIFPGAIENAANLILESYKDRVPRCQFKELEETLEEAVSTAA